MAKEDKGGKIRVIVFELEGSNETIQESLRTVASAIGRPVIAVRAPNSLPTPTLVDTKTSLPISDEAMLVDGEPVTTANESQLSKSKKSRPAPRTPQVIELDLKSGDMSLEIFCQQKNPSTDLDKYLIIATWLKRYRGIEPISQEHVYTCYRFLSWKIPKDVGQTFRNGKSKGYFRSQEKGLFSLTHIGDNKVQEME